MYQPNSLLVRSSSIDGNYGAFEEEGIFALIDPLP